MESLTNGVVAINQAAVINLITQRHRMADLRLQAYGAAIGFSREEIYL